MDAIQAVGKRLYLSTYVAYWGAGSALVVPENLVYAASNLDPRIVIDIALADANEIRRALAIGEGKLEQLPPGQIGNAEDCVLARALSNGWKSEVSSGATEISHPASEITYEAVTLAVQTLAELGFIGVNVNEEQHPESAGTYYISVPHTWAMSTFVHWYDRGAYPELVLDEDDDGSRVANNFKRLIEDGVQLADIYLGIVTTE